MKERTLREAQQYILRRLRGNVVMHAMRCIEEEMGEKIIYKEKYIESVFWWQPKRLLELTIKDTTHRFVKSGIIWRWRIPKGHEITLFR